MCKSISNGGTRCPVHQHQNAAAIKIAAYKSGLTKYQTERLFAELRREGKNSPDITEEQRLNSIAAVTAAAAGTPVEANVASDIERANRYDRGLDGSSAYAQRLIMTKAKTRGESLTARFTQIAQRTGLSTVEVAAKYKEALEATPSENSAYDQNTRRRAVLANLPFDRNSVVALEALNGLAAVSTQRRVTLIPAPANSHIESYGYDDGRLEVKFAGGDTVFAYHNIPEGSWYAFRSATNPGVFYSREIRGNADYTYTSAEASELDAVNTQCASCGQFRASSHTCPQRALRNELQDMGLPAEQISEIVRIEIPDLSADNDLPEVSNTGLSEESLLLTSISAEAEAEAEESDTEVEALSALLPVPGAHLIVQNPYSLAPSEGDPNLENNRALYPNWFSDDNPSVEAYVPTAENQLAPSSSDESRIIKTESGFSSVVILSKSNLVWRGRAHREAIGEEAWTKISEADDDINFVVLRRPDTEGIEIISYSDKTMSCASSVSGFLENGYNTYAYSYTFTRQGVTASPYVTETEEVRTALKEAENQTLAGLIEKNEAVAIEGNSTGTKRYVFDKNSESPTIITGRLPAFKKAIKENKIAIMPIQIVFPGRLSGVDDQGYQVLGNSYTIISGEVAVRRNQSGLMEVVSSERKLQCNCRSYRENYHCPHVNYAQRHIGNIAQQMAYSPSASARSASGILSHRLLNTTLINRGDVTVVSEEGRADYLSFGTEIASSGGRSGNYWDSRSNFSLSSDFNLPPEGGALTQDQLTELANQETLADAFYNVTVPQNPTAVRQALRRSDVQLPVQMRFNRPTFIVTGSVTLQQNRGELNDTVMRSHTLKCTCPDYAENYDCQHVRFAQNQAFTFLSVGTRQTNNNSIQIISSRFSDQLRAERDIQNYMAAHPEIAREEVAAHLADVEARRLERQVAAAAEREAECTARRAAAAVRQEELAQEQMLANSDTVEKNNLYRSSMLKKWEQSDESYTNNPKKFFNHYQAALARKAAGGAAIEYQMEDVTDGICADTPGARQFGVELEFDIKDSSNKRAALQKIGEELHAAGLTELPGQVQYHSARESGWKKWSYEQDCTVDAELVSPIFSDTPETWRQLKLAVDIINRNGGTATTRAGSHVHVSTASYELSTAKHAELLRTVNQNNDMLYRLASNPATGKHRGMAWCKPNVSDTQEDISEDMLQGHNVLGTGGHGIALNFESAGGTEFKKSNIEFRMWDATLDASVIQQQIAISAAITDYSERKVIQSKGSKKPTADRQPVGTLRKVEDAILAKAKIKTHSEDTFIESNLASADFFDKIFRRDKDKAAATGLLAITKWQL